MRLGLAFLAVALVAIAVLAVLTALMTATDVSALATRQRTDLTGAIAVAAGATWSQNRRWEGTDLSPILDLAARRGADVLVRGQDGRAVAASLGFAGQAASPAYSAPVTVQGRRIGEVLVRFRHAGLSSADEALQADLLRAIAGAAGLAALLALLAGLIVARRITSPIERIIAVTRAMGNGERTARVGSVAAPATLRELGVAFDQMADTLDREEQLRRDLVADVAHELRTPVAVLQAGHEALVDGIAQPTPDQLGSLRDEVLRLARMVNDLQALAAADAAVLHLSTARCDLARLVAEAAASMAGRFEAAGLTVDRRLNPVEILGDPRWLHQLITNLLTNALKYSPAGGRVIVATGPCGDSAMLTVADTGMGVSADELPRIFDRFWRGQNASQTSGSGIGLAIAAELAHAHGGRLAAASRPGQGMEMTLTLPRAEPSRTADVHLPAGRGSMPARFRRSAGCSGSGGRGWPGRSGS